MKRFATGSMTGMALLGAVVVMAAPAIAAPTGSRSVEETVKSLEAEGYRVILNKVGSSPLHECTVRAVRPGREVTELRQNARDRTVERVLYTTVYVDAVC